MAERVHPITTTPAAQPSRPPPGYPTHAAFQPRRRPFPAPRRSSSRRRLLCALCLCVAIVLATLLAAASIAILVLLHPYYPAFSLLILPSAHHVVALRSSNPNPYLLFLFAPLRLSLSTCASAETIPAFRLPPLASSTLDVPLRCTATDAAQLDAGSPVEARLETGVAVGIGGVRTPKVGIVMICSSGSGSAGSRLGRCKVRPLVKIWKWYLW